MAYDPKSYLDKALKEGFTPFYSQPASLETGEAPQYQGDRVNFGDIVVSKRYDSVPLDSRSSIDEIPDYKQSGYSVDSPLTGKYQGWTRSDVYDNDGKFVTTAYTPPDNDKYGLKGLAQLGMMAASFGGLGPLAKTLSQGIGALQSKNPMALLSAATGLTGTGVVPSALSDVMKYAGQANQVGKALKGDMGSIFGLVTGAASGKMSLPKGFAGGVDMSASDAIEGFTDPGGEGYAEMLEGSTIMEPDLSANLPSVGGSSASMQDTTGAFGDWYQEGAIPSYSGIPEWDDALDIILQEGKLPGDSGQTIEVTGRRDDMSIDPWLHPFLVDEPRMFTVTEGEPQTIEVTGRRPANTPEGVIIPDWDINPEPVIKAGGSSAATKTGSTGSTGSTGGTKAGGTGGTKSGGSKDTKDSGSGLDLGALFGIMGALANQQQPMRTASPNVARIDTESPFGLMYGLRG